MEALESRALLAPVVEATEPNDSTAQALQGADRYEISGTIAQVGDRDLYEFDVRAGDDVTVGLDPITTEEVFVAVVTGEDTQPTVLNSRFFGGQTSFSYTATRDQTVELRVTSTAVAGFPEPYGINAVTAGEICRPGDVFTDIILPPIQNDIPVPPVGIPLMPLPDPLPPMQIELKQVDAALQYEELSLDFTVRAPAEADALCEAQSSVATLPMRILNEETGESTLVGGSTAQATVTLFGPEAGARRIAAAEPRTKVLCDEVPILGIEIEDLGTEIQDNILLNGPLSPGSAVLRWSTQGFTVRLMGLPLVEGFEICDTGPLTYWVDLGKLGLDPAEDSFEDIVRAAEAWIHVRLSESVFQGHPVLPVGTYFLTIFDPGETELLVTGPDGRQAGRTPAGDIVTDIPGSAYFASVPAVVIMSPDVGIYQTEVRGTATGDFTLAASFSEATEVRAQTAIAETIAEGQSLTYSLAFGPGTEQFEFEEGATPIVAGPSVRSVRRLGFHEQPTRLVVDLDGPIDPSRAEDLGNYEVFAPGRDGRFGTRDDDPIPVRSVTYDAAAGTITILPGRRLNLHRRYRLALSGLTAPSGVPLDGDGDGTPGGTYIAVLRGFGTATDSPRDDLTPPATNGGMGPLLRRRMLLEARRGRIRELLAQRRAQALRRRGPLLASVQNIPWHTRFDRLKGRRPPAARIPVGMMPDRPDE